MPYIPLSPNQVIHPFGSDEEPVATYQYPYPAIEPEPEDEDLADLSDDWNPSPWDYDGDFD